MLRVEYEGLHTVCFHCGVVGHRAEFCPVPPVGGGNTETSSEVNVQGSENQVLVPAPSAVTVRPPTISKPAVISGGDNSYGPWL